MASGPITSWQIDGEKMEIVRDFISLDSKITVDNDRSHEIKKHLLLEKKKKSYDKPRPNIKKQRHHFADLKAMVFPVVMYRCENWTIKKAEELMLLNCSVGEDS